MFWNLLDHSTLLLKLWLKTTFDGRQPLMEDNLWWKMPLDIRRPLTEDDLWQKMTFDGKRPLTEDNIWKKKTFDRNKQLSRRWLGTKVLTGRRGTHIFTLRGDKTNIFRLRGGTNNFILKGEKQYFFHCGGRGGRYFQRDTCNLLRILSTWYYYTNFG